MKRLTIDKIVKATGGTLLGDSLEHVTDVHPTDISIDSRTVQEGDLFFAVQGERFDGHTFVGDALDKGAMGAVVSRKWAKTSQREWTSRKMAVVVEDTIDALQECARYYRTLFPIPVIAVTGTNGKTTTKDMIAAVLSQKETCLKTQGNENNHIGLPLTLFRLKVGHALAVVELGMRAKGEISRLAEICDPQYGIITNVGPAHTQFFSSIEEIAEAKGELLDHLDKTDMAVLNGDDPLVMEQQRRMKGDVITFGFSPKVDVRARYIKTTPTAGVLFETEGVRMELGAPGKHMVYNALAAVAVGLQFDIPKEGIRRALETFQPRPMRMELVSINGLDILNDAYNANPVSMRAALETLQDMHVTGRKIALLGDMLELGDSAPQAHREIGKLVGSLDLYSLVTVGELSQYIADEAITCGLAHQRVFHFASRKGIVEFLNEMTRSGDLLLVKGSRKMGLENVVIGLLEKRTTSKSIPVETT